jgi:hypothetical protein
MQIQQAVSDIKHIDGWTDDKEMDSRWANVPFPLFIHLRNFLKKDVEPISEIESFQQCFCACLLS